MRVVWCATFCGIWFLGHNVSIEIGCKEKRVLKISGKQWWSYLLNKNIRWNNFHWNVAADRTRCKKGPVVMDTCSISPDINPHVNYKMKTSDCCSYFSCDAPFRLIHKKRSLSPCESLFFGQRPFMKRFLYSEPILSFVLLFVHIIKYPFNCRDFKKLLSLCLQRYCEGRRDKSNCIQWSSFKEKYTEWSAAIGGKKRVPAVLLWIKTIGSHYEQHKICPQYQYCLPWIRKISSVSLTVRQLDFIISIR